MRSKIIIFIAGMLVSFLSMIAYWEISHPFTVSINYDSPEKSQRFMQFLESNNVPYSYTIDHLQRRWVKPHIENESEIKELQEAFSNQGINSAL